MVYPLIQSQTAQRIMPPHIFIDKDGLLTITNCYDYREKVAVAGAKFDTFSKSYKICFCEDTLGRILDALPPETTVDPKMEGQLLDWQERVKKMEEIREKAKTNEPVDIDLPFLKIQPFSRIPPMEQ